MNGQNHSEPVSPLEEKTMACAKAVVSTGHSLDERGRLHPGSRAIGFVNKPYETKQLEKAVREAPEA